MLNVPENYRILKIFSGQPFSQYHFNLLDYSQLILIRFAAGHKPLDGCKANDTHYSNNNAIPGCLSF